MDPAHPRMNPVYAQNVYLVGFLVGVISEAEKRFNIKT